MAKVQTEQEEQKKAKAYALLLLSKRNYSRASLIKKIVGKGISSAIAAAIALEMASLGYASDTLATEQLTRQAKSKGRGPRWLQEKLRLQGLNVCSYSHEEELEQLSQLLANEPSRDLASKRRIWARLQRRGFHLSAISQAWHEF